MTEQTVDDWTITKALEQNEMLYKKVQELTAENKRLREALDLVLKQVMLPHQITHDELICACNKAVTIIQETLRVKK